MGNIHSFEPVSEGDPRRVTSIDPFRVSSDLGLNVPFGVRSGEVLVVGHLGAWTGSIC